LRAGVDTGPPEWSIRVFGIPKKRCDCDLNPMRKITPIFTCFLLVGCTTYEKRTETVETVRQPAVVSEPVPAAATVVPVPVRPTLEPLVLDLQNAADGPTEGAALRRFHGWLVTEQLTFKATAVRPDTAQIVRAPTAAEYPLRCDITVYNKLQPYRDFGFQVKDNRNLTLLGMP